MIFFKKKSTAPDMGLVELINSINKKIEEISLDDTSMVEIKPFKEMPRRFGRSLIQNLESDIKNIIDVY